MSKSILVISYFTNMPGACQAEWIDDRMFAFIDKGYSMSLISATCSFTHTHPAIEHVKTPALSPTGAGYEYEEIKRRRIPFKKGWVYGYLRLMFTVNRFLTKLKLRSGEGRWSWFISSVFASTAVRSIKEKEFIFTTGGPASAHLTGILLAKLFGKRVICEFQDPLSGKDIGRNRLSHAGLQFFEKRIIKYADATIYCTKNAMIAAREKYAPFAHKIFYVYPGSNAVEKHNALPHALYDHPGQKKINITYLGSLYQTRNLDKLMQALDELVIGHNHVLPPLEIHIYGNMNEDIRQRILAFRHKLIFIHGLISRDEAMQKALEADVLLLIQNTDDRSVATIPFKTYDYLHTGKLILALVYKNDELENMMQTHGHLVCQADDVHAIKEQLEKITADIRSLKNNTRISNYTPGFAVDKMLDLINRIPFSKG